MQSRDFGLGTAIPRSRYHYCNPEISRHRYYIPEISAPVLHSRDLGLNEEKNVVSTKCILLEYIFNYKMQSIFWNNHIKIYLKKSNHKLLVKLPKRTDNNVCVKTCVSEGIFKSEWLRNRCRANTF